MGYETEPSGMIAAIYTQERLDAVCKWHKDQWEREHGDRIKSK